MADTMAAIHHNTGMLFWKESLGFNRIKVLVLRERSEYPAVILPYESPIGFFRQGVRAPPN